MLTLEEFNNLTETEKADTTWQGTFLTDRDDNGIKVQLYSTCSFYIEVFYDPIANKISRFRAFTDKSYLVPYLAHIKFNLH